MLQRVIVYSVHAKEENEAEKSVERSECEEQRRRATIRDDEGVRKEEMREQRESGLGKKKSGAVVGTSERCLLRRVDQSLDTGVETGAEQEETAWDQEEVEQCLDGPQAAGEQFALVHLEVRDGPDDEACWRGKEDWCES